MSGGFAGSGDRHHRVSRGFATGRVWGQKALGASAPYPPLLLVGAPVSGGLEVVWLVLWPIWSPASLQRRNGRDRAPPESGREQTRHADMSGTVGRQALGRLKVRSTRSIAQDAGCTTKGTAELLPLTTAMLSIW